MSSSKPKDSRNLKTPRLLRRASAQMVEMLEVRCLLSSNGLTGQYYSDVNLNTLVLTRTDPTVNFPWYFAAPATGVPKDNFSVKWTGQLVVPTTASYTMSTWEANGARLYINNQLVINDWVSGSARGSLSSPITLQAGVAYNLRMEFFSGVGDAEAAIGLQSATIPIEVIPTQDLFTSYNDIYPPTAPTGLASGSVTSTSATLSWTKATDDLAVTSYDVYQNGTKIGSTANLTYPVSGLAGSTIYSYTVVARDAAGNASPASSALAVTTSAGSDTQAPTAPTNVISTAVTDTTASLSWTAATDNVGVVRYDVYRSGSNVGSTTTLTYTDTGLMPLTTYSYTVKAADAANNVSPASTAANAMTAADTQQPAVPAGLAVTATTGTTVSLSWKPATDDVGVVRYDIYRNGTDVGSTTGATTYTDTGLTSAASYTYTVTASDAATNQSAVSASVVGTTPDTVPPVTPTGLQTTSSTFTTIAMSWTASTDNVGVVRYDVYRNGTKIGSSTSTTYGDIGLTPGTSYSYTIVAADAAGNLSPASAALPAATPADSQPPTVPGGLTGGTTTTTTASFSWTASTDNVGVVRYDVYRGSVKIGSSTIPSYADTGLTAGTAYSYTVTAVDAAGNVSGFSTALVLNTASATVTSGLTGYYYATADLTNLVLTRNDSTINFPWYFGSPAANVPAENFSVRWLGQVVAPATGSYTFGSWAADGVRLYINNQLIINDWLVQSAHGTNSAPITLTKGQSYNIRYEFFSTTGDAEVALGWTTPGGSDDIIPVNDFSTNYTDTYAPSAPTYPAATVKTASSVLVSWAASSDDLGVTSYDVYRNGTLIANTANTGYLDSGLSASTPYSYTIKARDAAGNSSAASTIFSVATTAAGATPDLIEADTAALSSGVTFANGVVSSLDSGDYFELAGVNLSSAQTLQAYVTVPLAAAGSVIEVHLDSATGTLAGTLTLQATGPGTTNPYVLQTAALSGASGVHNVFFVVKSGTAVGSIDWVRFDPTKQIKIMALGDSITQGPGGFDSYRYMLDKELQAGGYDPDFVGSQTAGFNEYNDTNPTHFDFDQNNEGHAGYTSTQVLAGITGWAQANVPDVLLIHIGYNDIWMGGTPNATIVSNIGKIIDAVRALNPNVKVVVAKIIPSLWYDTSSFNALLPAFVSSKTTASSPVTLVDMYTGYDPKVDSEDGVHPNNTGAQILADRWYAGIKSLL